MQGVTDETNLTSLIPPDLFFSTISVTPIWPGVANTGEHINIDNIQNIDVFFKEDKRLPYCHKTVDTNIFHNVSYYYYFRLLFGARQQLLLPETLVAYNDPTNVLPLVNKYGCREAANARMRSFLHGVCRICRNWPSCRIRAVN